MIDYVFPYVDCTDKQWQITYKKYCQDHNIKRGSFGNEKERFRDWGDLLRFVFRSIAENMPWINNIFFIVQSKSQIPEWLDTSKVKVVLHSDFIPDRYLPTYNSTTIEMFLWNIPELGEQFIYGNDDLFALSQCQPTDFFSETGLPKLHLLLKKKSGLNSFRKTILKGQEMIRTEFPRLRIPADSYYRTAHLMSPMLKSVCNKVWISHRLDISRSISAFRTDSNVNQYIYLFYEVFSQQYMDYKFPGKYLDFQGTSTENICRIIRDQPYKVICINDSGLENERQGVDVYNSFLKVFNKKCKYERFDSLEIAKKEFNELELFKNSNFVENSLKIKELYLENFYKISYIPYHPYPWLVSIPALRINNCFSSLPELRSFIKNEIFDMEPIMETIGAFKNNPLMQSSNKIEISFGDYSISKEANGPLYIIKEDIPYDIPSLENTWDALTKIKEEILKLE